MQPFL